MNQTLPLSGSNRLAPAAKAPEAKSASEAAPTQSSQLDLLSLSATPPASRWGQTLRSAGRVFVRFGLSALGGALGGLVGLAAGAVIGGAQAGLTQGRKTGLLAAGLSAAVGLAGMALGPVGGAALALGSLALGAWHGSRIQPGDDPKDAELTRAYANAYLEETRAALAGKSALKDVPKALGAGRSKKAVEAAAAQAVFAACQLAATNLPSAVGVALAGKAAHRILKDDDLQKIDDALLKSLPTRGEQAASDSGLARIRYADTGDMGPAVAAISTVVVNPEFAKGKDAVTMDFVVGHELSHIRHKDAVSKLGQMAFSSLITSLAQQEGDPMKKLAIATRLMLMSAEQSREMEFRADREGADYALSKGHSSEAVQKAATELFAEAEAERIAKESANRNAAPKPGETGGLDSGSSAAQMEKLLETHPPNPERIEAVRNHLSFKT